MNKQQLYVFEYTSTTNMCIINDTLCITYDAQWHTVWLWHFWSFGRFSKSKNMAWKIFSVILLLYECRTMMHSTPMRHSVSLNGHYCCQSPLQRTPAVKIYNYTCRYSIFLLKSFTLVTTDSEASNWSVYVTSLSPISMSLLMRTKPAVKKNTKLLQKRKFKDPFTRKFKDIRQSENSLTKFRFQWGGGRAEGGGTILTQS